jgi:catechol 2,3-dioxygenase-like lactoylglutathione lyase family enzyme
MIEGIDHVNLVVADLDVMTAFYRDVLGFHVTKQVTIDYIRQLDRHDRLPYRNFAGLR